MYRDGEKVGGFKLSSVGKTACPFEIPDGVYEVYRTYDPRIDTVKNLIGDPPRFDGGTQRKKVKLPGMTSGRKSRKLPEMSFYVGSVRNLEAVLPYADRVYYEMNQSFDEACSMCRKEDVEFVAL